MARAGAEGTGSEPGAGVEALARRGRAAGRPKGGPGTVGERHVLGAQVPGTRTAARGEELDPLPPPSSSSPEKSSSLTPE